MSTGESNPGDVSPAMAPPPRPPAPRPDEFWDLPGGMAWVYYAKGRSGIAAPVILSDGFLLGSSTVEAMYDDLDRVGYPFLTTLRQEGHDVVLLGYKERSASILDNKSTASACIQQAAGRMHGRHAMTVGGFSMGGLVTRYALADMERRGVDHHTSTYLSYDTPHRGAWSPISVQALAHFFQEDPYPDWPSRQINAPAARQQIIYHIATADEDPIAADPLRTQFLDALRQVGWFPSNLRKLGVANGRGDGVGNGIPPDELAMTFKRPSDPVSEATLRTQSSSPQVVAQLRRDDRCYDRHTTGMPEYDGAPGSTLDSVGMVAAALSPLGQVQNHVPPVCFVPTASAISLRDVTDQASLYDPIRPGDKGDLDAFMCASENQMHVLITEELCRWILDRLAE